jgi:hypothetical protein
MAKGEKHDGGHYDVGLLDETLNIDGTYGEKRARVGKIVLPSRATSFCWDQHRHKGTYFSTPSVHMYYN